MPARQRQSRGERDPRGMLRDRRAVRMTAYLDDRSSNAVSSRSFDRVAEKNGSFVNKLKINCELLSRAKPPSTQRTTPAVSLEKRIGMNGKTLAKR